MEMGLQYEIQRSRPHYDGFMYDIYHQATEQVKLADRLRSSVEGLGFRFAGEKVKVDYVIIDHAELPDAN